MDHSDVHSPFSRPTPSPVLWSSPAFGSSAPQFCAHEEEETAGSEPLISPQDLQARVTRDEILCVPTKENTSDFRTNTTVRAELEHF